MVFLSDTRVEFIVQFLISILHSPHLLLFLTPIPNLRVLFLQKNRKKKIVLFHGKRKCLQPLGFLPSFSAGLTGRRVHCLYETRRSIVPVQCSWFLRSRMCPRAYFVRLHARIVRLTDTRLGQHGVTSQYAYTAARLNGRAWLGWKKRILLGGQIAVAFVRSRCEVYLLFDGVVKNVKGREDWTLRWIWWNSCNITN